MPSVSPLSEKANKTKYTRLVLAVDRPVQQGVTLKNAEASLMMMQGCKETKSSVPVTATPESLGDSGVSAQRNPRSCTDKNLVVAAQNRHFAQTGSFLNRSTVRRSRRSLVLTVLEWISASEGVRALVDLCIGPELVSPGKAPQQSNQTTTVVR
jgi:hypothetical protein